MYLLLLIKLYGKWTGLKLYFSLKVWKKEYIKLPSYSAPIRVRQSTQDIHAFAQIFLQREYELELPFMPSTIIDAGANVGYASLFFNSCFRDAEIVALEPDQQNFSILTENCGHIAKVKLENKALHSEGKLQLDLLDSGLGSTGFATSESTSESGANTVESISPKDILESMNWNSIDLFKIDIEGGEQALFSAHTEHWLPKTKCVVIEFHERFEEHSSEPAFKALAMHNFRFYDLVGENLIFINKELT